MNFFFFLQKICQCQNLSKKASVLFPSDSFINFFKWKKKWLVRIPKKGLQDFEFVNRQLFVGDEEDSLDSPEEIILQQKKRKKKSLDIIFKNIVCYFILKNLFQ